MSLVGSFTTLDISLRRLRKGSEFMFPVQEAGLIKPLTCKLLASRFLVLFGSQGRLTAA